LLTGLLLWFGLLTIAQATLPIPSAPKVGARGYILVDFNSGRVLAEKEADERMEPASLTKLMTAYVVFRELKNGHISLTDKVTVSEKAWRAPGSRMFIEVNKRVSVEDLIQGMIVQSGNDASIALAEFVAGSEDTFAEYMNQHARRLGMNASHFMNATGLPHERHYTTARDIATLARALIREFPDYYRWYSQKEFTFNNITQQNRNKLLWRDPSVDGMKTGYTKTAGYCLVTSAKRKEMRLISVVLGTKSQKARETASQALLNYGYRFFETHRLYEGGKALQQPRVFKAENELLPVGVLQDLYVTLPRGRYEKLKAEIEMPATLMAPLVREQPVGTLRIRLGDKVITETPLVALADAPEGGIWRRMVDSIMLWFH
jgi:D-alanyl-D-alanine carboxypeptidase (penicillin-binding protein 5/6)